MKAIRVQVLISLLVLSISAYSNADTYATSDDGKRIKLNANGTWQYLEERKWSADDPSYSDDLVHVSLKKCRIFKDKNWNALQTEIQLSISLVSETKILYPTILDSSIGSQFNLKDSFGNDMKVYKVSPSYKPNGSESLRPGQTIICKITAHNYPLKLSTHLIFEIHRNFLGTEQPIILKIPTDKIEYDKSL